MNISALKERLLQLESASKKEPIDIYILTVDEHGNTIDREHLITINNKG